MLANKRHLQAERRPSEKFARLGSSSARAVRLDRSSPRALHAPCARDVESCRGHRRVEEAFTLKVLPSEAQQSCENGFPAIVWTPSSPARDTARDRSGSARHESFLDARCTRKRLVREDLTGEYARHVERASGSALRQPPVSSARLPFGRCRTLDRPPSCSSSLHHRLLSSLHSQEATHSI